MSARVDAVVVGSGPNGLAAAITIAKAGRSVLLVEGASEIGGGLRTAELTLPGFRHDVCSAIHPLAMASPFFERLGLERRGLQWTHSPAALAHPFDDGTTALLERSIAQTGATLDPDAGAYHDLLEPVVRGWASIDHELFGPLPWRSRDPLALAQFGLKAMRSASGLSNGTFRGERARAFFAGLAAHSVLPLERPLSAAIGLVLGALGHVVGWPFPRGGAQNIARALTEELRSHGGEIQTGRWIRSLDELPACRARLLDVSPTQLLAIAGNCLPTRYRRRLLRFRHGPGICKVDLALDGPVPWTATACARAATVHLGGTFEEIADSERRVWRGEHPDRPYVLLAQHGPFDPERAPRGKQTVWAYCHVPRGSTLDVSARIERQIERFAPGFRDRILARSVRTARQWEHYNPNYVGGDITGGIIALRQLFTRPAARWIPYSTPVEGLYLCSSSTPPGGGVHGMCGFHAARAALRRELA